MGLIGIKFVGILLVIVCGCSCETLYEDCGSQDEILYFAITDCDMPPCIVERPGLYNVDIIFTAASSSETLDTTISARIGSEDFPWPAPNACYLLTNASCPIVEGVTYTYKAVMPVLSEYPAVTAVVTWKLTDEFKIDHVCTIVPVTLV